jgi:hypothetical protein
VGLIKKVVRQRGGAAARRGSAQRHPRRREGRRRLRLAPGAVGEDEGGEGGSKLENGGGFGGSHRGLIGAPWPQCWVAAPADRRA